MPIRRVEDTFFSFIIAVIFFHLLYEQKRNAEEGRNVEGRRKDAGRAVDRRADRKTV